MPSRRSAQAVSSVQSLRRVRPMSDDATCGVACVHPERVRQAQRAIAAKPRMADVSSLFRVLGDQTRLRLATALAEPGISELCVCDLSATVGASASAVSHSLRSPRQLGIVRHRRLGKVAYYRIANDELRRLLAVAQAVVERPRLL